MNGRRQPSRTQGVENDTTLDWRTGRRRVSRDPTHDIPKAKFSVVGAEAPVFEIEIDPNSTIVGPPDRGPV